MILQGTPFTVLKAETTPVAGSRMTSNMRSEMDTSFNYTRKEDVREEEVEEKEVEDDGGRGMLKIDMM